MLEVKPTVFASLPRFFEKIHARVVADIEAAPEKERKRFNDALDVGRKISRLRQSRQEVSKELQTEFDVHAAPVLKKVKDYFGGRIRLATSEVRHCRLKSPSFSMRPGCQYFKLMD